MKKHILFLLLFISSISLSAQEGYIGEIRIFAGNFAPRNWAFCEGQTLPIQPNAALFSLLGTMYGGDGISTFKLPDLRGRVPVHPDISNNNNFQQIGATGGTATNTLTLNNLPPHNHTVTINQAASSEPGTSDDPTNRYPAATNINAYSSTTNTTMATTNPTVGITGTGTPVNNIQPYLTMNYIICLYGLYPSRQ